MSEPTNTNNTSASDAERASSYDGAGGPRERRRNVPDERSRGSAARTILVLVMLLLILLLIAAATGRSTILRFAELFNGGALTAQAGSGFRTTNANSVPPPGSIARQQFEVGPTFRAYYAQHGGVGMFGLPISPEFVQNGRTIQWFERARLERWPEYDGTPYAIQGGRIGMEFVRGREFPNQTFFVSQPGMRFFPETNHSVRGEFLRVWEQNDGIRMFGLPISEQIQEQLPNGQTYTVQYFERARIEYHPEYAGTPNEMMLGLLGTALYYNGTNQYSAGDQLGISSTLATPTPVPLP